MFTSLRRSRPSYGVLLAIIAVWAVCLILLKPYITSAAGTPRTDAPTQQSIVPPTPTAEPTPSQPEPQNGQGTNVLARISHYWPAEIARWSDLIAQAAAQYSIDPDLVAAVMMIESGGNPNALSRSGAIGLMQIMPFHSCASWDPDRNIMCGVHILAGYYHLAGDDWRTGLAYYNCGPTGVRQNRCGTTGGYAYADTVLSLLP